MNTVFLRVSEGVKLACSKSFRPFIYCRSKFISGSEVIQKIISTIGKILKQVRNDTIQLLNFSIIKRTFAFTLAETLIVMGIIGVVAALTLPNLNSSTGDKEKVVKVKKIYQNLNDALGRAEAVYGPVSEWFVNDTKTTAYTKRFAERITEFMKLSKNCGTVSNQGCFTSGAAKQLSGINSNSYDSDSRFYKIITADGISVGFFIYDKNCERLYNSCGNIELDIDGPNKGAYTDGKDIFVFHISSETGIIPGGDKYTDNELKYNCFRNGTFCTGWVIQNGNMDYLKLDSNFTCPDGKTVLDWTTNTTCK